MQTNPNKAILIISQYYWPEDFIINDIAEHFAARGDRVDVLTGIPNYPAGKYYAGYGLFQNRKQNHNGVVIKRVAMMPRGAGKSDWRLVGNYVSYFMLASIRLLFSNRRRYDSVLVYGVSPLLQAIPARMVKKRSKVPYYIHLADLWPDTLFSHGISKGVVFNSITKLCSKLYGDAAGILITSAGFRERLISYGVQDRKVIYVPQWADASFQVHPRSGKLRSMLGIKAGDKAFMFAGNMGFAQGVEVLMEAMSLFSGTHAEKDRIHFIFVGDGTERQWCEDQCRERGLCNCHFIGKKPRAEMPAIIAEADVMLVTLKDKPNYALTLPGRMQAYMACGKPILASANGETGRVIAQARCGWCSPAGDADALCRALAEAANCDRAKLAQLGANARDYSVKTFNRDELLERTRNIVTGRT